ncbi:LOW QUALITY PROTEIN: hypothetical protein Cgig2_027490 [Carnegiea gigantea]|uniref:Uncharacterized protein n=1 Tax=Carnegiea gigantea TaxID=171969 RepID=A0A9Q1KNB7_9CARY|nr:LOW QUALITY PROTEIN: hypothetical protein Cgig2_027490 [Carnegiea gigantea]
MLPPKKGLVFRLLMPSPDELDDWEHSVDNSLTPDTSLWTKFAMLSPCFGNLEDLIVVRKMVRSLRCSYFSNRIRAFPNTPNYLTSRVDLLESGSPDYGPAPVYGYGDGPSDGDSSSSSNDGGSGPFSRQPVLSYGEPGPSYPTGAPRACSGSSHSTPS